MSGKKLLLAGLLFNMYWSIAVLGQQAYVWVLVLLVVVCWWKFPKGIKAALSIALVGVVMDLTLSVVDILAFDSIIIPSWLIMLWLGFGTFVWFMRSTIVSYPVMLIGILGGIGGSMSYFAGYRLEAVQWPLGVGITLSVLFVIWLMFSLVIALMMKRNEPHYS
ncbi:DUF2878 family protein [Photobacterium rosenbergii]|uniref:DUF2878 family protein n=1 Tax=Photobacterium rosenbergii TaxID=294936 RepID=A0ABU3ZC01_9GAMM|nr:DUF2878 family protein [Photobacterium rosenbergii]MDV5167643.1 DUF2878 family protein [Photobacterium rosenbergii]